MWCALRPRARLLSAAAALACLAAAVQASPTGLPTEWRAGKATYYGGMPDGCAYALHSGALQCLAQTCMPSIKLGGVCGRVCL
jgi:hypothetical protein